MKWCGLGTSWRMSVLGFNRGKGRADSEPAHLGDQFTGARKPQGSERPQPKNQNKTQKTDEPTKNHCLLETLVWLEPGRARHHAKIHTGLRRSRYHQQPVTPRGDGREERAEPRSEER